MCVFHNSKLLELWAWPIRWCGDQVWTLTSWFPFATSMYSQWTQTAISMHCTVNLMYMSVRVLNDRFSVWQFGSQTKNLGSYNGLKFRSRCRKNSYPHPNITLNLKPNSHLILPIILSADLHIHCPHYPTGPQFNPVDQVNCS